MYVEHGLELPDTPTMALHRGRLDLLEEHLRRDPGLLGRTFTHEEIYPPKGGHTALFATVVSQPAYGVNCWKKRDSATFARMVLDRGADPNVRASLRKQLHPGYDEHTLHEYRDVTPLSWGERFHRKELVSRASMQLIASRGGKL
jgi:hypothetical protein